jgi:hypothetical protein
MPLIILVFEGSLLPGPTTNVPSSLTQAGRELKAPQTQQNHGSSKNSKSTKTTENKTVEVVAWEVLTAGVTDEKPSKRVEAIVGAGSIGPLKKAAQLVQSGLSDKDASVRQVAAATLGEMRARMSIPKLRESLDDKAPEVSFAAARSLWLLGDHSGRDIFIEVLSGERSASEGVVKSKLRKAQKEFHNPAALALIGAKEAAGALFGPLGWGISAVEELVKDKSASAQVLAASLLGTDRSPDAIRELDDALADKNWTVRAAAARALAGTRLRTQIPKLEPLLEDDKDAVRYAAAASIVRLLDYNRETENMASRHRFVALKPQWTVPSSWGHVTAHSADSPLAPKRPSEHRCCLSPFQEEKVNPP